MIKNNEEKDLLYYRDLIYEIKYLARFEQTKDEEVLKRIIKRQSELNSGFTQDIIEIIIGISRKTGVSFRTASAISGYPELVNEVLEELENKVNIMKCDTTAIYKESRSFVVTSEAVIRISQSKTAPTKAKETKDRVETFERNNLSNCTSKKLKR